MQFWFVVAECPHGPDSAETRGVLHAVTDRVVGLPVVCNDSGGLVQTLSLEVLQLQLFYKDVAFLVVALRLFPWSAHLVVDVLVVLLQVSQRHAVAATSSSC